MRFDTFNHFIESQSYTRTIEVERMLKLDGIEYLCSFEIAFKLWRDESNYSSIDAVSSVAAYDMGGHQVRDVSCY